MVQNLVVLDTDVFSVLQVDPARAARRGHEVSTWTTALAGVRGLIAFQTRAEVLAGLRSSNWGPTRMQTALVKLSATPTIPADRDVVDAYAELTAACKRDGHALHDKIHTGDRWVAACAIAKGLPLLSGDRIFRGAPGLSLRLGG